ncbi:T9SS type A sorting domain-containing protein [Hymenobacter monticola]|uniref:T9SS type A sorting domain-containing protein n=1 Tax=Hymenobacter monticola TaxID=1705399 RepID=A0ABY4BGJ7_9BACT|nr:T9SS type A sorting domain-containing protein [Hymenobacter monticola]UOE36856.1 T9SS type A sorting domain-containing protein [Hymenobacter monticola]
MPLLYSLRRPIRLFIPLLTGLFFATAVYAQNTWVAKAPYGGGSRKLATAFTIGSRVYVGTGVLGTSYFRDFWEYNPQTDTWTQKALYAGAHRVSATGFSIGGVGFLGLGQLTNGSSSAVLYAYDVASNAWVRFSDFPLASGRYEAATFVANNRAYVTCGTDGSFNYRDCWEFNPLTDTWTQKANFGGSARAYPSAFSIGGEGYVGLGASSGRFFDLWRFTPATNVWTRRADFPGGGRSGAVGFALGTVGYFGTGFNGSAVFRDLWEYNPATDAWTQRAPFGGVASNGGVAAVVGSRAYVGLGSDANNVALSSWFEYTPLVTSTRTGLTLAGLRVYPNPAADELRWELPAGAQLQQVTLYNALGQAVVQQSGPLSVLDVRQVARGTYTLLVVTSTGSGSQRVVLR